jgi:hypothetical protein
VIACISSSSAEFIDVVDVNSSNEISVFIDGIFYSIVIPILPLYATQLNVSQVSNEFSHSSSEITSHYNTNTIP